MSKQEQKEPTQQNENAVLGNWLAGKYIKPFQKFDETFPETSKSIQDNFSVAADHSVKAAKTGLDLGKTGIRIAGQEAATITKEAAAHGAILGQKGASAMGTFLQNRGADIIAYGATAIVLTVRGFFNAIDYIAEKVAKPIAKAYRNWEPKTPAVQTFKKGLDVTGNTIAKGYNGYVNFFKGFDYPKSLPALAGLGAAQGAVSLTGIHYMHDVMHTIAMGHGSALHYAAVPTLIAVGKGSNLLTLKPGIKLAKTTKDGFFESDLYKEKLQPVYMKKVDPWVQLTKQHIQEWDNMIENRVAAYKKFKENMKNQGEMKERVRATADKVQSGISKGISSLRSAFSPAANDVRNTNKPSNTPSHATSPSKAESKLDDATITDKWQAALPTKSANDDAPEVDVEPNSKPAQDGLG